MLFKLRNNEFVTKLIKIAIPVIIQNLIMSLLNFVDIIMIGSLGEVSIAAVGLSNQMFFLLNFFLFGISSGTAIFAAQFWGKKLVTDIHKVLGLGLLVTLGIGTLFTLGATVFPRIVLSLYSDDPMVVAEGVKYLFIVGFSYLFTASTYIFAGVARSTEQVKIPMLISIIALGINTLLNYCLIFGNWGFPKMGVEGAALATLIARVFECLVLLVVLYLRREPSAASIKSMMGFDKKFVIRFFKTSLPVVFSEVFWSTGMTVYYMIYARIGTEAIAAINICNTVEGLAFVLFTGINTACAIMIGGKIGEGKEDLAQIYAKRFLLIGFVSSVVVGFGILLSTEGILSLYNVSSVVQDSIRYLMVVLTFALWVKTANMIQSGGILRSGGDTLFALIMDASTIWIVGVPLALVAGFVLHLPIYWVVAVVMLEEVVKFLIGFFRVMSKKWINNLVKSPLVDPEPEPVQAII